MLKNLTIKLVPISIMKELMSEKLIFPKINWYFGNWEDANGAH